MGKRFYKNEKTDKVWWIDNTETVGEHLFSFDKKRIFNLFQDYPYKLTKEEKRIFDKENPYWAEFFKDRSEKEDPDEYEEGLFYDFSSETLFWGKVLKEK